MLHHKYASISKSMAHNLPKKKNGPATQSIKWARSNFRH